MKVILITEQNKTKENNKGQRTMRTNLVVPEVSFSIKDDNCNDYQNVYFTHQMACI